MQDNPPIEPASPDDRTSQVIKAARSGDMRAIETIAQDYLPLLVEQATMRMGHKLCAATGYEPEDLASEAMFVALRRLCEVDGEHERDIDNLRAFLTGVVRNKIKGLQEKFLFGRRGAADEHGNRGLSSLSQLDARTSGVITKISRQEQTIEFRRALETLDDADRNLVELRGIEGQPYSQIQVVLEKPRELLRTRYSRALRQLRQLIPSSRQVDLLKSE